MLALLALLCGLLVAKAPPADAVALLLLSEGKAATTSSVEGPGTPASAAFDSNLHTRWSSQFSDPQWIQVDLGRLYSLNQVSLNWEAAYAKGFQIQISADGSTWDTRYSTQAGPGGIQNLGVNGQARYVRLVLTARATGYGYSLWEIQVYGTTYIPTCGQKDVALNRSADASSAENASTPATAAVDGNTATRWSSAFSDPQWLKIDLGRAMLVCQVTLNWELARAKEFQIQVSYDALTWTTIYSASTAAIGRTTIDVSGNGRYLRIYGTSRATSYGYSLWDVELHAINDGVPPPP